MIIDGIEDITIMRNFSWLRTCSKYKYGKNNAMRYYITPFVEELSYLCGLNFSINNSERFFHIAFEI